MQASVLHDEGRTEVLHYEFAPKALIYSHFYSRDAKIVQDIFQFGSHKKEITFMKKKNLLLLAEMTTTDVAPRRGRLVFLIDFHNPQNSSQGSGQEK